MSHLPRGQNIFIKENQSWQLRSVRGVKSGRGLHVAPRARAAFPGAAGSGATHSKGLDKRLSEQQYCAYKNCILLLQQV